VDFIPVNKFPAVNPKLRGKLVWTLCDLHHLGTGLSPGVERSEAMLWRGSASSLASQRRIPSPHSSHFHSTRTGAYWSKYACASGTPGHSISKNEPLGISCQSNPSASDRFRGSLAQKYLQLSLSVHFIPISCSVKSVVSAFSIR
jgi:hypothetical protein